MSIINENAQKLLAQRYFLRDEEGRLLEDTAEEMFARVARAISKAEKTPELQKKWRQIFFDTMKALEFIPSSPQLMNSGTSMQQISSCFILDVEDSIESIMDIAKDSAIIFKSGGGVGMSMRNIRPKGDIISTSKGEASGVVSFMNIYNILVDVIKNGGRRKGAILITIPVFHPEIMNFISCKTDTSALNNMNISVGITTKFMEAVINDEDFELINPKTNKALEVVRAKYLFDKIVEHAHATGEPGIIFLDVSNKDNPNPQLGNIDTGNPCSEFQAVKNSSCNLGSINLSSVVSKNGTVNWVKLYDLINIGIRFLDDGIDINQLPLQKLVEVNQKTRPVGLGVMGFANLLFKLKIPYNSIEAERFTDELFTNIRKQSDFYTELLGSEKGYFPECKNSIYKDRGRRNSTTLSIAPTGSISFIIDETGGIECEYALVSVRRTENGDLYYQINSVFKAELEKRGLYSEELIDKIAENHGSIQSMMEIPEDMRKVFVVAHDISPEWHLRILSNVAKHVDLSCSKTINFPNDATVEQVSDAYMQAYKLGTIKGITVYRDGSRENQTLTAGKMKEDIQVQKFVFPSETLKYADATRFKVDSGCGSFWLFLCYDDNGDLREIFSQSSSSGGCQGMTEALSRITSLALKSNIHPDVIIDQLKSVKCPVSLLMKKEKGLNSKSCSDAIGNAVRDFIRKENTKIIPTDNLLIECNATEYEKCPECGEKLRMTQGCVVCPNMDCGWSRCG